MQEQVGVVNAFCAIVIEHMHRRQNREVQGQILNSLRKVMQVEQILPSCARACQS